MREKEQGFWYNTFLDMVVVLFFCFIAVLILLYNATEAKAADVSQLVFTCASSAKSAQPNLRIKVSDNLRATGNTIPVQALPLSSGSVYNYYLTKTITFPVTDRMAMIEVQVDQDTWYTINSETVKMKIYTDVPLVRAIKK